MPQGTGLGEKCQGRAGLTPFYISFKIGSKTSPSSLVSMRTSVCLHAPLLIRAQRWCWAPHLLQIDLEHGGSLFSSFLTGLGPHHAWPSPTCIWVVSQDPVCPLPNIPLVFRFPSGMNWGSGRREGGSRKETQFPL